MAAVHNGDGTGYFQHADWLGSSRFAHDGSGTVKYDRAYAPFGEVYAETGGATNRDFTGQTEDTTPGLYDFLFRQQSQSQGRWLVPDPAGLAAVDLINPQTWNRYAYVANNPLNTIDPSGLMMDEVCGPWFSSCGEDGNGNWWGIPGPSWWPCCGGPIFPDPPDPGPSPAPNPPSQPMHFPNETLGIPNGMNINFGGIWGAIIPTATCGDMGPCNPIGTGYADVLTWPVVWGSIESGLATVGAVVGSVILLALQQGDAPPKGKWLCTASCPLQGIGDTNPPFERVTGVGWGNSETAACLNAKRAATQSAPRGTYPRHCDCDCKKR
jgi:RHS repeat-associated protein